MSRGPLDWNLHTKRARSGGSISPGGERLHAHHTRSACRCCRRPARSSSLQHAAATTAATAPRQRRPRSTAASAETTTASAETTASGATTTPGSGSTAAGLDTDCTNPGEPVTPPPPPTTGPPAATRRRRPLEPPAPWRASRAPLRCSNCRDEFKEQLLDPERLEPHRTSTTPRRATTPSMLIALAAEYAKSDGSEFAEQIVGDVRRRRRPGEKCTTRPICKAIIDAGELPDYDGQSGPITMNGNGEPLRGELRRAAASAPTTASTTARRRTSQANAPESAVVAADPGRRRSAPVTACSRSAASCRRRVRSPSSDHPSSPACELAIEEINAAGGVLGKPGRVLRR